MDNLLGISFVFSYYLSVIAFFSNVYYSRINNRNRKFNMNYKVYKYGMGESAFSQAHFSKSSLGYILFLEEFLDTDFPSELKQIFSTFTQYVNPTDLEYCLLNLQDIKIIRPQGLREYISNFFSPSPASGSYYPFNNYIKLYYNFKSVLSHEFIHMCSTNRFNPNLVGFCVASEDTIMNSVDYICSGLNEGYTELLNQRIFYGKENSFYYTYNVKIARMIEAFFDDPRDMETAFFHNDVDAVYRNFCRYGSREEFFSVMNMMDNFAGSLMPNDIVNFIRIQLKLYEIVKRSKDDEKIEKIEAILNENPLIEIIKNGHFKLFRFDDIQKGFKRK